MKFSVLAGVILALIGIAPAAADTVPMDPDAFTQYVLGDFKAKLPDYDVSIAGPLSIKIVPKGGGALQANLDRMHDFCARNADACADMLKDYVAKASESVKSMNAPPDPTRLRVVVRPVAYANELRQQIVAHGQDVVLEPLSDELVALCYFDFPTAMRVATAADFAKLGMSKDQVFAQARQNVAAALGSLDGLIKPLPENGIGQLAGNVYYSSLLALHDAWSGVAKRSGGRLIVAVPAADLLLYAERSDAGSIDALRTAAQEFAKRSDRPISTSVYRWTAEGWERVAP
ncbi:MAG TPA: hypothetical protein VHE77_07440 [Dongiaceae bacterium]|nr:hypothetical protein [Dongiaceae bacterium]